MQIEEGNYLFFPPIIYFFFYFFLQSSYKFKASLRADKNMIG